MRVFLAGATGAIGRPLLARLVAAGHEVIATTRSEERARKLAKEAVEGVVLDAFDADAVKKAIASAKPEVVIHQLTSLPKDVTPSAMKKAVDETARLRSETVPTFVDAARAAGARRVVVQSISFVTRPSDPPTDLDEDAPLWLDGPADVKPTMAAVQSMESKTTGTEGIEGVVLRYGFFYGPGTWYDREGTIGRMIAKRRLPIIGNGKGKQSFIHIDDAADVTLVALERGAPGIYNICDDSPVEQNECFPAMAEYLGAKRPFRIPAWLARITVGAVPVHYATTLCGAKNDRAKAAFDFRPRSWKEGFREVFGTEA